MMLVVTTDSIPGRQITTVHGTAFGVSVFTRGVGGGLFAAIRSFLGREAKYFGDQLEVTRTEAMQLMSQRADEMGGTAITAFRFDTNTLGPGMLEVVAYGTVVTTIGGVAMPLVDAAEHAEADPPQRPAPAIPPTAARPPQPVQQQPPQAPQPPPSQFY